MSKFKVGDRVITSAGYTFDGKECVIVDIDEFFNGCCVICPAYNAESTWFVRDKHLTLISSKDTKILITTDGTTTLARLYEGKKVVKSAEAKCAPSDKFDFTTGANLAYDRLMGRTAKVEPKPAEKPQDKPEPVKLYCVKGYDPGNGLTKGKIYEIRSGEALVYDNGNQSGFDWRNGVPREWKNALFPLIKRPAKVGEWVYVMQNAIGTAGRFVGKALRVVEAATERGFIRCSDASAGVFPLMHSEYLVLDGYKEENQ